MKKLINISEEMTIKPVFKTSIPVAFSSSDYFAPYLGVAIQSIIDSSTPKNNYDIVVFTSDMSENNQNILCQMVSRNTNFSIRFVNVSEVFSHFKLHIWAHYSINGYFRLVAPLFMKDYQKIIFLDSDLIILEDIANLYNIDIFDYSIGACAEYFMLAIAEICGQHVKDYLRKKLGFKDIDKYFNTGVMIMNIPKFIKHNFPDILLDMVSTFDYDILEQDALNELFNEDVCYIPNEWNYAPLQKHMKEDKFLENMSDYGREKYLAITQPKILHFANRAKVWFYPDEDWAETWWKMARKTPYYELILANMIEHKIKQNNTDITNVMNYKRTVLNYWKCKVLRNLTFGKKRKHYVRKKEKLKEKIRQAKEVLKR